METYVMINDLEEDDGMSLMKQGKNAEAKMYFKEKLSMMEAKFGKNQPEYFNIMEKIAFLQLRMGNYREAKEYFENVVRKRETSIGDCHPHLLRIHMAISLIIKRLGNKSEADLLYRKLRKINSSLCRNNVDIILCGFLIAVSYLNLSKITEAEKLLQNLLEKSEECFWNGHPLSLLIKVKIGHALLAARKYTDAAAYYEEFFKIYDDLSEKHHFLYYYCQRKTAVSRLLMNMSYEAKIQLEDILKGDTVRFGTDDVRFGIIRLISKCCVQQYRFQEAKTLLEGVLEIAVQVFGEESWFTLKTTMDICVILIYMRNFANAKCLIKELVRKVATVFGEGNRLYLNLLRLNSVVDVEMGNYREATVSLDEILLKQLDVVGKYHDDYLTSKALLAHIYTKWDKFADSLHVLRDILRIQSSMIGVDHLECLHSKIYIAATYINLRQFGKSELILKEVIKLRNERLGEDNKGTVIAMGLMAVNLFGLGKKNEASTVFDLFLKKLPFLLSDYDLIVCISQSLMSLKEYENCKKLLQRILKIGMEFLHSEHPFILDCQLDFARSLLLLDRRDEAKAMFDEVLGKISKVSAGDHLLYLESKTEIALAMKFLSDHEKAIILLEEVRKTYEEVKDDFQVIKTMTLIADSLSKLGKKREMNLMIEDALTNLSKVNFKGNPLYLEITSSLASLSSM